MSLRKRGPVWWIDFVTPSGERVRRSAETGNKGLAQELHDRLKAEAWTGLRASNITGMQWDQVDLERRMAYVHPDQAKARRAIPVPLNGEAVAVLQKQLGKHREVVFTYRGEPITATTTKAWYAAVKRAGVHPLRFHDLRHTFASWHVQQGTPLSVLQELGGWQSPAMVQRYAHLGAEHLAPWNDRLAAHGTNVAQRQKDQRPSAS